MQNCYDPASNLCQFTCDTHDIRLDCLTAEEKYVVSRGREQDIQVGKWRLSWYNTKTKAVFQVLGRFLVFTRNDSITISNNEAAELHFPRTKVSVVVIPCPVEEPEKLDEQMKGPSPKSKTTNPRKRRFSNMENDQSDESEPDERVQAVHRGRCCSTDLRLSAVHQGDCIQ